MEMLLNTYLFIYIFSVLFSVICIRYRLRPIYDAFYKDISVEKRFYCMESKISLAPLIARCIFISLIPVINLDFAINSLINKTYLKQHFNKYLKNHFNFTF